MGGQAVVTLNGRDFYLGPYRSKASKVEYDRLIGEWLANGRRLPQSATPDSTVAELLVAYLRFAKVYYDVPACGYAAEWDTTKQAMRYPCVMCYKPQGEIVRPNARVLAFTEGILRALAKSSEKQIDAGRWTVAVEMVDGLSQFTLAIADLLSPPDHRQLMQRGFPPDRRAMEQMHAQMNRFLEDKEFKTTDDMNAAIQREFVGKPIEPGRFPPRNPVEQAQDLCYQAFDSCGRRRLQLARKALGISLDCADGYVLLADHMPSV